ncbi:MAG: SulP family inorganic anion transporter [Chitinophagaceae bacterium]|nr:MAG: SulP family inorganic anion transporter [Chitinophagaceae bacterium]
MNTKNFKTDLPSGLVVFLVALPLCLGISLASGAPFFSGLISGIIGGIVIGALSGSRLSVSGPAAGLAALVLASITNLGAFDLFLCAVVIAGGLQILMSVAKLGGIANYFPSSVVNGLLTSIGILIIAKQIPHAVGYDKTETGQLVDFVQDDWHELFTPLRHIDVGVLIICVISILVILLWDRPFIKKRIKFIPGALVAVIVAVIVNEIFKGRNSAFAVGKEHLVQIEAAKSFGDFLGFFTLPDFSGFMKSEVWITGVMIAIIASLETLLSIEAIDNLDPQKRLTNTNRELFAQGVGNSVAGLIGGLPITSVIVRSSANVHAGAQSKFSTIFHGILLFVCVVAIPTLLNYIPLSALAAILLLTGYKLCKLSVFSRMIKNGKYQYIPFFVTVLVILGIDLFGLYPPLKGEGLLIGVVAGLIAAFGAVLHGNLKNSYYFHRDKHQEGDVIKIRLSEEVSFLNKASLRVTLDKLPNNSRVLIDASRSDYIDFDVLELIKEFKFIKAPLKNIECELLNFKDVYRVSNMDNVQSVH